MSMHRAIDDGLEQVWRHAEPYLRVRDNLRHTRYCCHFARALLASHPEARAEVVMPAMVLHDVGWSVVPEDQIMLAFGPRATRPDLRRRHEVEGARLAAEILGACGYPHDLIVDVTTIVDGHDTHDTARSIEDAIVRDADKLWRYTPFGLETVRTWFGHSEDEQMALLTDWSERRFFTDAGRTMATGLLAGLSAARDRRTAAPRSLLERIIIPADWGPGRTLRALAARQRIILLAGLPGVGKSLLVQQITLMAQTAGRQVHLLQWDVTRAAFERPEILARFPEVDGVTHAAIRQGVGAWARGAVQSWHERFAGGEHLLIVEAAIIGNRLRELAVARHDEVEELLSGPLTTVILPVPTAGVRRAIEDARVRTMANPRHVRESSDAPPDLMRGLWRDVFREAHQLGLTAEQADDYNADAYRAVYEHWLRDRQVETLVIDRVLDTGTSVYEVEGIVSELVATPDEVATIMSWPEVVAAE
jgi:hypothetical protein